MKKNSAQARTAVRDSLVARVKARLRPTARLKSMRGSGATGAPVPGRSRGFTDVESGVARILDLERQLVLTPARSPQRRLVMKEIRLEAALYRKSLDAEQTLALHDPHGFK